MVSGFIAKYILVIRGCLVDLSKVRQHPFLQEDNKILCRQVEGLFADLQSDEQEWNVTC